jgi:hypothetical protein
VFEVTTKVEALRMYRDLHALAKEAVADGRLSEFLESLDERRTSFDAGPRFKEFAENWYTTCSKDGGLREATVISDRQTLDNHLLPVFGSKHIRDLGPHDIDKYKAAKQHEKHQYGAGYAANVERHRRRGDDHAHHRVGSVGARHLRRGGTTLVHYDGTSWTPVAIEPQPPPIGEIMGTRGDDVFLLVGLNRLLHWNGTRWAFVSLGLGPADADLRALYVEDDHWIVAGIAESILGSFPARLQQYLRTGPGGIGK